MKYRMIVTNRGGRCVFILDENDRLVFYKYVYSNRVVEGVYTDPIDIVEILRELASKGHATRDIDHEALYAMVEKILEADMPVEDKTAAVIKLVRSAYKTRA